MDVDPEILEDFISEIRSFDVELLQILEKIESSPYDFQSFLNFSQIVDRIFGTANTLGFSEIATYVGAIRIVSRKCGNSKIERSCKTVFRLLNRYMENIDLMLGSISDTDKKFEFLKVTSLDLKVIKKMDQDVFDYSSEDISRIK